MHPFKNQISLAILCLQESGRFGKLRQKWFETESLCPDDESVPDCGRDGLKNENMVGVFLVPTLGFVLSSIAALLEHVCDVIDIEADESSLLFLCQEWAISRYPRSNFDLSNVSLSDETANDSSSSSETTPRKSFDAKLKHFITKVDKRALTIMGQIEIPAAFYEQPEAYCKPWHMAASGNDLLLYVQNGDFVYHFEGGRFNQELSADYFHKKLTTSITGFKIRESLLYIGTDDNVLSVYNWKELNCKVIIKIPDAENGNFALMGKSLTVTVSKQKLPSKEDENCGSNDNSHVKRSEIKHLRFVDVGTKDTFRKPVSLKDFKIVTAASNGKLVLYKSLTNELVYQNI
ncbi:uncharacterized protein LOC142341351 [Convolutriloba macropyga]|uniref:uncharacterized protein LOC142341351 n=1 Tax=Convolutriloba macropyga TaxID=536237 RepID=UPI003F5234DA